MSMHHFSILKLNLFVNRIREIVNFELGEEIEICFSSCHKCGTKEKFQVPIRNGPSDLGILCSSALPLSHRYSIINKAIGKLSKLKIYHLSKFIYEHDTIDIADPSSMQDACHI